MDKRGKEKGTTENLTKPSFALPLFLLCSFANSRSVTRRISYFYTRYVTGKLFFVFRMLRYLRPGSVPYRTEIRSGDLNSNTLRGRMRLKLQTRRDSRLMIRHIDQRR